MHMHSAMAISNSSKRLACSAIRQNLSSPILLPFPHPSLIHRRTLFDRLFGRKKDPKFLDPLSIDYLKRKPVADKAPQTGGLDSSSIFDDSSTPKAATQQPTVSDAPSKPLRNRSIVAAALDPTPHARKRWQRKMIIREIRGRHRMSKTVHIARTERASLSKSPMFKTSVKKLYPLARQIAGKPIKEAILQMRFSKKKVAKEVKRHLEYARNEAIVTRGMGLGRVKAVEDGKETEAGAKSPENENKAITVLDKKGKRRVITDPTNIYIDQAWVGRGKYGKEPEYRAYGRINTLRPPTTSISVVLKEEATRIRLADQREQKRERKRAWVPLPDRPITAQRQYCLW